MAERLTLDLRPQGAASGRRGNTRCQHTAGVQQPRTLCQTSHTFVVPHASWRLLRPQAIHGLGAVQRWQQRTPAMAAGLTDRVWSLKEVLMGRGPPWPQPQG